MNQNKHGPPQYLHRMYTTAKGTPGKKLQSSVFMVESLNPREGIATEDTATNAASGCFLLFLIWEMLPVYREVREESG